MRAGENRLSVTCKSGAGRDGHPVALSYRHDAARADHLLGDEGDVMSDQNQAAEPHVALTACVARLLHEFERAISVTIPPERERQRYIFVLTHLIDFFREIGATSEARYIHELGSALADLDDGVVRPFLKPTDYGSGRRRDDSNIRQCKGRVAVGLDALIRSGMSRQDAAKHALREYPHIKRLITTRSKNLSTEHPKALINAVLSWHDDLCRNRSGNSRVKGEYNVWSDTLEVGRAFLDDHASCPKTLRGLAHIHFSMASRI